MRSTCPRWVSAVEELARVDLQAPGWSLHSSSLVAVLGEARAEPQERLKSTDQPS